MLILIEILADAKYKFIPASAVIEMEVSFQNSSLSIEFVRAIAEGELVALHTHQVWPDSSPDY